jgi:Acetoacetate decarboxylase (ADC)
VSAPPPPAPWHSDIDALLWLHPATAAARDALPPELAPRAWLPVTVGGLISYREGPVGPYGEIFGAPLMLRGAPMLSHVAFMAVDSERSVAGGRGNWALPKVLATFDGDPGVPGSVVARGDGWAVGVRATARTRRFPMSLTMRADQVWEDGGMRAFSVRMRGRARLARVEIEYLAPSPLSAWLAPGRHLAVVISGRQVVTAPRPPRG